MEDQFYDEEEKGLIESVNAGNWQSVDNLEQWKTLLSAAAHNTLVERGKKKQEEVLA
jgi:hypothetical protein